MTWQGSRTVSRHEDAIRARCRDNFREVMGEAAEHQRANEITTLPSVEWRGKRGTHEARVLYTLRCQADFGKGPHDVNVPESMLWQLLNLKRFLCPYHR